MCLIHTHNHALEHIVVLAASDSAAVGVVVAAGGGDDAGFVAAPITFATTAPPSIKGLQKS